MGQPLVSVITPVLNSAETLEMTLSSVAAQTYPNVEHIVVDGGSTDGTIEILRRFSSSVRLRWLSEPDTGMYAALNKGMTLASGEVMSYLNSDDLYLPWSVERAVSALSLKAADLVYGDLLVLVKKRGVVRDARIQFYPEFRARVYAHEVNLAQPTVFWHRRVPGAVGGFDEQLRYCGDFEYWLRTGVAGFKYTHVSELLAVAVEHEGALSALHADELEREIARTRVRYGSTLRPRRLAGLHALTRLMHWRWEVLRFRAALRKRHPPNWSDFIAFLRGAQLTIGGSNSLPLLLPTPLPKSWAALVLDGARFERELIAEIANRTSTASS